MLFERQKERKGENLTPVELIFKKPLSLLLQLAEKNSRLKVTKAFIPNKSAKVLKESLVLPSFVNVVINHSVEDKHYKQCNKNVVNCLYMANFQ